MTDDEFRTKNERRLDLIEKKYSGFTEEEDRRRFDAYPGWKEEFERRVAANLTDAEHAELDELTQQIFAYVAAKWPKPLPSVEVLERLARAKIEYPQELP